MCSTLRSCLFLGVMFVAGRALAAPGDLPERGESDPAVVVRAASERCALRAGLCLRAGAATTQLPSPPVASTDATVAASAPSRYVRKSGRPEDGWRVALSGHLRRSAWAGNALFVFFDLSSSTAVEEHRYTALYQANVARTTQLGADLLLLPDAGFQAGHSYRLRVAQLISGKEVVLGEADFVLE